MKPCASIEPYSLNIRSIERAYLFYQNCQRVFFRINHRQKQPSAHQHQSGGLHLHVDSNFTRAFMFLYENGKKNCLNIRNHYNLSILIRLNCR